MFISLQTARRTFSSCSHSSFFFFFFHETIQRQLMDLNLLVSCSGRFCCKRVQNVPGDKHTQTQWDNFTRETHTTDDGPTRCWERDGFDSWTSTCRPPLFVGGAAPPVSDLRSATQSCVRTRRMTCDLCTRNSFLMPLSSVHPLRPSTSASEMHCSYTEHQPPSYT